MNKENSESEKKNKFFTPKRVFVGVLSLGALGFGFWYATRKTNKLGADDGLDTGDAGGDQSDNSTSKIDTSATSPKKKIKASNGSTSVPKLPASDFPLKKGSRGEKVKHLQQTLMAKYPNIIKSADGIFGSATESALISKGLPTEISESQYNVLTAVDPETTAQNIYNAASKKDFKGTLAALQNIKNTKDYQDVNEKFKPKGLIGGSNTTIVTGLLLTFTDQSQKDQLNVTFSTMGLEKKDGKWFVPSGVSGIERKTILTTQPTRVWRDARHMVNVGNNTILGYEVRSGEGITVFDTIDGYRLNVVTAHVKYN